MPCRGVLRIATWAATALLIGGQCALADAADSPSFAPGVSFTTGAGPNAVAASDVNGDGAVDLVTTNFAVNSVSVLLGNGAGGFAPRTDYPTGTGPVAVVVADVNRDGKLDIVVANQTSNTISVLLGNGQGSFAPKIDFLLPTGAGPRALVVADINLDGKPDIIVANTATNSISKFIATSPPPAIFGAGSFTRTDVPMTPNQTGPVALAVADFDRDGKPDIAVVSEGTDWVTILRGSGSVFNSPPLPTGCGASAIAASTPSRDGKPDFVVACRSLNKFSGFFSTGSAIQELSYGHSEQDTASRPQGITVGDFNGDGIADVAVAHAGSSSVLVFDGATDDTTFLNTFPAFFPRAVVAADFNGDGRPDLAVVNNFPRSVSVFLNTTTLPPAGAFTPLSPAFPATMALGLAVGDVYVREGFPDVLTGNTFEPQVSASAVDFFTNNLGQGFSGPFVGTRVAPAGGGQVIVKSLTLADFDRDGKLDLVVTFADLSRPLVFKGTGSIPAFTSGATVDIAGGSPFAVAIGDVDRDGILDLVIMNQTGGSGPTITVHRGTGALTSTGIALSNGFPLSSGFSFSVANPCSGSNCIITIPVTAGFTPQAIALADFDRDGKLDLLVASSKFTSSGQNPNQNATSNHLSLYLGKGDGTFGAPTEYELPETGSGSTMDIAVGDLNGDGKLDIVVVTSGASTTTAGVGFYDVLALLGDGTGFFEDPVNVFADVIRGSSTSDSRIALADMNRDGRLDLVMTRRTENQVTVLFGTGTGAFIAHDSPVTLATISSPESLVVTDLNGDGLFDIVVAGAGGISIYLGTSPPVQPTTFHLSPGLQQVNEGNGSVRIAVSRTGNVAGAGSVTVTTTPGCGNPNVFPASPVPATPGEDYTTTITGVTFAPGETLRIVTIPIAPTEPVTNDLAVDPSNATIVRSASRPFTIADLNSIIQITRGAGFTTGYYKAVGISPSLNAALSLDHAPAAPGSTGGSWTVIRDECFELSLSNPSGGVTDGFGSAVIIKPHRITGLVPTVGTIPGVFNLQVTGTNFVESSRVQWNCSLGLCPGAERPTRFASSVRLDADVNFSDIGPGVAGVAGKTLNVNWFSTEVGTAFVNPFPFVVLTLENFNNTTNLVIPPPSAGTQFTLRLTADQQIFACDSRVGWMWNGSPDQVTNGQANLLVPSHLGSNPFPNPSTCDPATSPKSNQLRVTVPAALNPAGGGTYFVTVPKRFANNQINTTSTGQTASAGTFTIGTSTNRVPTLSAPTVTPSVGTASTTLFTFHVTYTDLDNNAPFTGFPRVWVSANASQVPGSPFAMTLGSGTPATGAVYQYATTLPPGNYSYFFEAADSLTGAPPTATQPGPTVNAIPQIQPIPPLNGAVGAPFPPTTFTATGGTAPLSWAIVAGDPLPSPMVLSTGGTLSGTPAAGTGGFTYTPVVRVTDAVGASATQAFSLTIAANAAPTLTSPNVSPSIGVAGTTSFAFTVTYADADGHPPAAGTPLVHILLGGSPIVGSPFAMTPVSGGVYRYTTTLPTGSGYAYAFEGRDSLGTPASGTGTQLHTGPTVVASDTAPPAITIMTPTTAATFDTTSRPLTLGGTTTDNVAVLEVTWANDRGGSGTAIGTSVWSATGIPLAAGVNNLTVTARDVGGNTTPALLQVFYFTDTLSAQVTRIAAVHFTDLRDAINVLRTRTGLGAMSFTGSSPAAGGTILASHFNDLRTAMTEVCSRAGCVVSTPAVAHGTQVTAAGLNALRALVRELR